MTKNFFTKGLMSLCAACTLLFTIGCTSSADLDFADPNNPDQNTATIQLLVTGIESGSRLDLGIYLRAVDTIARDTLYFEPSDPRYTGELLTGPIDPGGFITTRPWGSRYSTVKNCNILLDRASELSDSGAAGFAKTMMVHELLMNLNYTDVNGVRTDVGGEVLGPIVGKSDALNFMASTLDSGLSDLGAAGSSFSFNLTSGFAGFDTPAGFASFNRGLRARIAAYQGDWQGVLDALGGSFLDASSPLNTALGVYHVYTTGAGDLTNPVFEDQTATTIKYHAHPSFAAGAEAGDHRLSKISERDSRTYDGLVSAHGVALYTSQTSPIPMMRNEELVLLRAEANINLGNLSAAEADLNLVREAAGLAAVSIDSSNAVAQLIHERRYSLFAEGHRWIDMRRWNLLNTLPLDRATDIVVENMPIPTSEQE